jgi:hypothetical protein
MTNPTSNFGWQMPTGTNLVKDLPADFETFGQAVDTTVRELIPSLDGVVTLDCATAFSDVVYWSTRDAYNWTIAPQGPAFNGTDLALMNSTFPIGTPVTVSDGINTQTFTVNSPFVFDPSGMSATTAQFSSYNQIYFPASFDGTVTQAGKYLTNNGTLASWETVEALPNQMGNAGKYLTTDGTTTSWNEVIPPLSSGVILNCLTAFSLEIAMSERDGDVWLIYGAGPALNGTDLALLNSSFPVGTPVTVSDGINTQTFTIDDTFQFDPFGISVLTVETVPFNVIYSPNTFSSLVSNAGKFLTNDGTNLFWS